VKKVHEPVLLQEILHAFKDVDLRLFFEGTVGAGGHAEAILKAHPEIKRYFACDRDFSALKIAKETLKEFEDKIDWIHGPYADVGAYLKKKKVAGIDGFFIDIGVSSMQLDQGERGFSFMSDAPLDMRMDVEGPLTAKMIVNKYPEKELARIFFEYGEERRSRQVAKAIVEARRKKPIETTFQLSKVIEPFATKGKLHPSTLVFQALRIVVNDELGQLERGLKSVIDLLNPGGRVAVISFHSLEDRIVKNVLRDEKKRLEIVTKKPMIATAEEMKKNPRSRSAKLRVAEKK
jgi:16S rRNA (cytosine1402-N4)-methyltransferase